MVAEPREQSRVTLARLVVDQHTALHDKLAHPSPRLAAYFWAFASDTSKKLKGDPDSLAAMWWPYQVHKSPQAAAMWAGDVASSLFQARTFQVTAQMVDVVSGLYHGTKGIFHLEEPELPAPHGFLWLDKPLTVTDRWGRTVVERAYTWGLTTIRARYGGHGPVETLPSVRVTTWNYAGDAGQDDYFGRSPEDMEAAAELYQLSDLMLSHTLVVPFGERHPFYNGPMPAEGRDYQPDSALAWLHHLWMVMEQEITVTAPVPLPRQARRIAQRSVKHGEVSVVLLRRTRTVGASPDGHRDVDWSCRWIVQGFYRHIDSYLGEHHQATPMPAGKHCAVCHAQGEQVRVTWVHSHIKGPDGLPLKAPGQRVYRLAR